MKHIMKLYCLKNKSSMNSFDEDHNSYCLIDSEYSFVFYSVQINSKFELMFFCDSLAHKAMAKGSGCVQHFSRVSRLN